MTTLHQPARQACAALILISALTLFAPVVAGETPTTPAASVPATAQSYEQRPFQINESSRSAGKSAGQAANTKISKNTPFATIFFFIVLVGGGLWAVLLTVRKYLPGGRQLFASPAMEVLGRTYLDPKRSLCLVRVGKRVIVVGAFPDGLKRISEITDESEVTELLDSARPKTEAGLSVFQQIFFRNVKQNVQEVRAAETAGEAERKAEELAATAESLREQVRAVAESATLVERPAAPETNEGLERRQRRVRDTRALEKTSA
jgi:flagellar biogenesis protein FliO